MKKTIKKSIFIGILSISMAAQVSGSAEQVTATAGSAVQAAAQAVVQAAANARAAIALSVAAGAVVGAVSCVSLVSGNRDILKNIADFLPFDKMLVCRATNRLWLNATRAHFNLATVAKGAYPVQIGAPDGVTDSCVIQLPGETPRVLVGSSDGSVRVVNLGDVPVPATSLKIFDGNIGGLAALEGGRVVVLSEREGVAIVNVHVPAEPIIVLQHEKATEPGSFFYSVAVLSDGRIVYEGPGSQLFVYDPKNPGSLPTNIGYSHGQLGDILALPNNHLLIGVADGRLLLHDLNVASSQPPRDLGVCFEPNDEDEYDLICLAKMVMLSNGLIAIVYDEGCVAIKDSQNLGRDAWFFQHADMEEYERLIALPNGRFAVGCNAGQMLVFDSSSREAFESPISFQLRQNRNSIAGMVYLRDGRLVTIGTQDSAAALAEKLSALNSALESGNPLDLDQYGLQVDKILHGKDGFRRYLETHLKTDAEIVAFLQDWFRRIFVVENLAAAAGSGSGGSGSSSTAATSRLSCRPGLQIQFYIDRLPFVERFLKSYVERHPSSTVMQRIINISGIERDVADFMMQVLSLKLSGKTLTNVQNIVDLMNRWIHNVLDIKVVNNEFVCTDKVGPEAEYYYFRLWTIHNFFNVPRASELKQHVYSQPLIITSQGTSKTGTIAFFMEIIEKKYGETMELLRATEFESSGIHGDGSGGGGGGGSGAASDAATERSSGGGGGGSKESFTQPAKRKAAAADTDGVPAGQRTENSDVSAASSAVASAGSSSSGSATTTARRKAADDDSDDEGDDKNPQARRKQEDQK